MLPSGCRPTSMMRGCSRWYKKWLRFISRPTSTPQYIRGAVASVSAKVTPPMMASTLDTFHSRSSVPGLMRLVTAVTTTAASTDWGTW
ncbi:hypothetical protein D3C71_1750520 [compost metagenome]